MKIVLVGYMGSGKTTIGKLVAKRLKIKFLDLDGYIEKAEEQTIAQLFLEKGELYFRKKEFFYLNEILSSDSNFLLSTGGGTPCYGANMEAITHKTANSVYLKVSLDELVRRLSTEKAQRPLIRDIANAELPEFIGKHLFERSFYYNQANITISYNETTPEELANELVKRLV
ncbi:shikimate kinase [Maribacter antarcticus]|uniref:shikimate kinase n=1 Tax=Maribacter antarcticus TaxID=505250 RepID=UPI00047A3BBF|nr:shikimate kinase [Maribacter antarcticus]